MNKVGIYCRLSDEDRLKKNKYDDSESIANQKSMLIKYALNQNWDIVNIYSDDDFSGASMNRPQFQKLIEDCKNGVINIVLCKTQSRFSRDMEVIEKYIHNKFIEWGIRFVSIIDNADTAVQGNKKVRQINGLINEWYIEDLSNNIRRSLKNKREDGQFLGSFAPYGYKKDPNDKNKLMVDSIASEVVKKIYALYKYGYGYSKIAHYLNNNNIPSPAKYKKMNGSKYVCGTLKKDTKSKWTQESISKILKNEVYIGNLIQGKRTYVSYKNHTIQLIPKEQWIKAYNTHIPIIDMNTWNIVKKRIESRTKVSRITKEIYVLSKKVYCKECRAVLTRQKYHVKKGTANYLKCKNYKNNHNCYNKESVRCEIIENYVLDEINKQIHLYYNLDELQKNYLLYNPTYKLILDRKKALDDEKIILEEKIVTKNNDYKSLYEDKLKGIISKEEFLLFKDENIKIKEEYQKRIKIIEKELDSIKIKEKHFQVDIDLLKKYKCISKLTKEIVDEFVDKVYIGKLNSKTKKREIDIHLNIINI